MKTSEEKEVKEDVKDDGDDHQNQKKLDEETLSAPELENSQQSSSPTEPISTLCNTMRKQIISRYLNNIFIFI